MILRRRFSIIGLLSILSACTSIENVTGSFEESMSSGRIQSEHYESAKLDKYRFFRLHLRQFEDDIGGTFETFDLSSYAMFSQLPVIMETPVRSYYCARIDHGHIRNNKIFIYFTDAEQRHWAFSSELGDNNLSGSLMRVHANGVDMYSYPDAGLMREDEFYYQNGGQTSRQIVFDTYEDRGSASLNCVYYYRSTDVDFIIPRDIFAHCRDTHCTNMKLAVIGTEPQSKFSVSQLPAMTEILSATLESIDLLDNIRTIDMRDNPFSRLRTQHGLFIAAAFIYDDLDQDGHWSKEEPIHAGALKNTLLFFDEETDPQFYGRTPGSTEQQGDNMQAIISKENFADRKPGWTVCEDNSETHNAQYWRLPVSIKPVTNTVVLTSFDHSDKRGCLLKAVHDNTDENSIPSCTGIIPILYRQGMQ